MGNIRQNYVSHTLFYFFFSPTLLKLFLENPSEEALQSGKALLTILSPFYFVVAIKLVTDGVLKGMGMMKEFMIDTFSDLILRVSLSFILSSTFLGSNGIWLSWPIGWIVGTVLAVYFYKRSIKKLIKIKERNAQVEDI